MLAGFALSLILLFGGLDLLSHNGKHLIASLGRHGPHDADHGAQVANGTVDAAALAAALGSLASAFSLKNHARIRRVMRVSYPPYLASVLPGVLSNPFHFLTLSFSALLLLLPLLSLRAFVWVDGMLCIGIALSMLVLGVRLALAQGRMLLMSHAGRPPLGRAAGPGCQ